jgi:hypothetical protein
LNLIFLLLVKIFPLILRNLKKERRRIVGGNDAWGADLQLMDTMLEHNCQLLPKKLGEKYL